MTEANLMCPVCTENPLQELQERKVPFLGCTECYGLFVTEQNLQEYLCRATGRKEVGRAFRDLIDKATTGTRSPSMRTCPRCQSNLMRMGYGESPFIIIDRCEHGIWLDKPELKKMIRSTRAQAAVMGLIPQFEDNEDH